MKKITKATIYVDNDDEITSITDKVQSADADIVALILPKRCTVLQSLVNMKILGRAARNTKKQVVLITSEATLLPVAGAAGLYVAKTLQSKPVVPPSATEPEPVTTVESPEDAEPEIDESQSIGELDDSSKTNDPDDDTPIELGDEAEETAEAKNKKDAPGTKEKKNKKLKVPNFDSFRLKLFIAIGLIIIVGVLWYVATRVLPRATITITTQTNSVPINIAVDASPSAEALNSDTNTVPAKIASVEKTETKKFSATGEKNNGNKASGTVTLKNCSKTDGTVTVPSGTGVTNSGLTFITQADTTLPASSFSGGGTCTTSTKDVAVIAQNGGDQYNISSGRTFSVAGFSSVVATNAAGMSGGTNNIVKTVTQADCDGAKNELLNTKTEAYKSELTTQLTTAGFTPISDSFSVEPTKITCSPDVGAEATESTATVTFKASMTGINTADLTKVLETAAGKDLQGTQSVIDTGIQSVSFTIKERKANGDLSLGVQSNAQVGVKQDAESLAASVAGKKRGETASAIKALPGVIDVKVEYSPFWVSHTPKNVKHITVSFVNDSSQ